MKKIMLSQPMADKSEREIIVTRDRVTPLLESQGYKVINTIFTDEWYSEEAMKKHGVVQIPLCFLAKSLETMSRCDAVYFCKGWENARGCRIEHEAAKAYGLEIIYEDGAVDTKTSCEIGGVYGDDLHKIAKCKGVALQKVINEMVGIYVADNFDLINIYNHIFGIEE